MKISVRQLAVAGILGAVSIVMGYVPGLGLIPVPTPAGHATILHVPAIIAGVAEGPVVGALVGLIFGLVSMLRATAPAQFFVDPLISVLPRIFIGVTAAYAFALVRRWSLVGALITAGVVGTLTNTVLVLSMIVFRGYLAAGVAVTIGLVQGTPEVVVAAIVLAVVGAALGRAGYLKYGAKVARPVRMKSA
ncbi:MAG TPA: ECF transporter S component [Symbiobacteriaceae bacterium]